MSTESKWNDFSPELKAEVQQAVHGDQNSFVPSPLVRDEAHEHTRDGGIFSSSTLSHADDAERSDNNSVVMSLPSEALLISDKLADHVRGLPQDNSPYDDGAVIQRETTTVTTDRETPYTD